MLTEKQKLFCKFYLQSFNATQAYLSAYASTYKTASVEGSAHLAKPEIKKEITRLKKIKNKKLFCGKDDIIEKYLRIAFADIGNYIDFGSTRVPMMDCFGNPLIDENKNRIMKDANFIKFLDKENVDTELIEQIKQGKDGVSIKLKDSMRALEWLANYFELNPMDKHKKQYDNKRLELEEKKIIPIDIDVADDGFIEALNDEAAKVWDDED